MAQLVEKFAEPGDPEYAPPPKEVELPVRIDTHMDFVTCVLCYA